MPSVSPRWRASEVAVGLSKFRPLATILAYDDFDQGLNGWTELTGNYRQDTMAVVPGHEPFTDLRPPMLSSATFPIVGTHGSMSGIYSMKLATRAVAGPRRGEDPQGRLRPDPQASHLAGARRVQFEMWFTYKPEADRPGIGEDEFRAFGVLWDLQDDEHRYFPAVRYLNAANGVVKQKWQFAQARKVSAEAWSGNQETSITEDRKSSWAPSPASIRSGSAGDTPTGAPRASGTSRRRAAALLQRDDRQDQLALPPVPGGLEPARVRGAPVQRADVRPAGHPAHARARVPADLEPAQPGPLGGGGTRTAAASCSSTRPSSRRGRVPRARRGGRGAADETGHTAVLERFGTFSGDFATEPYEAGWAEEAIFFIRVDAVEGAEPGPDRPGPDLPRRHHVGRRGHAAARRRAARRRLPACAPFRQLAPPGVPGLRRAGEVPRDDLPLPQGLRRSRHGEAATRRSRSRRRR